MKKQEKNLDAEEIAEERLKRYVLTSTGHMIWKIRMQSSLSHNKINMQSSLNSSTEWRLEHNRNCQILTFAKVFNQHFKSLKCAFKLHLVYYQIDQAMTNGKCLALLQVDSKDIYKYDRRQIIFQQDSSDKEEQQRRILKKQQTLHISGKLVEQNGEKRRKLKRQNKKKGIKKRKLS